MQTETTIDDRIQSRIARIATARDQVVGTLIADLKASILAADKGGQVPNPLECRAVALLERMIAPEVVTMIKPAAMGKSTNLDWEGLVDLVEIREAVTTTATLLLEAFPDETLRGNQKIGERRAAILNRAILTAKSAFFRKVR